MKKKEIIFSEKAPKPAGHYSQAVIYNDICYISGILPVNPSGAEIITGDVRKSVYQVFDNLKAILQEAKSDLGCLLKVSVYVSDIRLWSEINSIYAEILRDNKPARTVLEIPNLHHNVILELDAIAYIP